MACQCQCHENIFYSCRSHNGTFTRKLKRWWAKAVEISLYSSAKVVEGIGISFLDYTGCHNVTTDDAPQPTPRVIGLIAFAAQPYQRNITVLIISIAPGIIVSNLWSCIPVTNVYSITHAYMYVPFYDKIIRIACQSLLSHSRSRLSTTIITRKCGW